MPPQPACRAALIHDLVAFAAQCAVPVKTHELFANAVSLSDAQFVAYVNRLKLAMGVFEFMVVRRRILI